MDPRLDRLFSSLEAQFGAAIARAEEEAADDLALSLRQDVDLETLLLSGSWLVSTASGWEPVCEVAKDHVRTESGYLIRSVDARFLRGMGDRPVATDNTLAGQIRRHIRRQGQITLHLSDATVLGRPIAVGETHLLLGSQGRDCLLPLTLINRIKLSHEDSADAS